MLERDLVLIVVDDFMICDYGHDVNRDLVLTLLLSMIVALVINPIHDLVLTLKNIDLTLVDVDEYQN